MRNKILPGLLLLTACASGPTLNNADGLQAERLEIAVDSSGWPTEVEYHIEPGEVPPAVHAALEALYPDGEATAAEKEYQGSQLYWELSKEVDGFTVEAMFLPDGTLHSQEIEVPESKVPEAVRSTVSRSGYGPVRAWEEIRDGERELVEYHAKTTRRDRRFKLLVSPDGELLAVFREVEAEIELPVE